MIYFKLKRQGFNMRFSDIREYYATFMTKFLNPAEIDFLQGRLSTSVFMKNYSNPVLIKDLRRRVFPGISEMQVTLSKTLSTILFGFQKPYTPQGLRLLREIYDKANLRVLSYYTQ